MHEQGPDAESLGARNNSVQTKVPLTSCAHKEKHQVLFREADWMTVSLSFIN